MFLLILLKYVGGTKEKGTANGDVIRLHHDVPAMDLEDSLSAGEFSTYSFEQQHDIFVLDDIIWLAYLTYSTHNLLY